MNSSQHKPRRHTHHELMHNPPNAHYKVPNICTLIRSRGANTTQHAHALAPL